jgi:glycolate oxidase FAD binding subunit
MLSDNGQFLPFDPPLAAQGATLGGTVAANLSGCMRYHYGGVRDFILGVQFLDSQGQLVRSGGKVVKNAAGFDIPKLMVGSLGSLGTIVELSFKVFPRHEEYISIVSKYENLVDALSALIKLSTSSAEIICLELTPQEDSFDVIVRLGGDPGLFQERISHIPELIQEVKYIQGEEESMLWEEFNEFNWIPEGASLVKVPLIPKYLPKLDEFLKASSSDRRYSAGANVAWIAWSDTMTALDQKLKDLNLKGLTILGSADKVRLGAVDQNIFYKKIKTALDPSGLWVEV